jgi:hypothetical protein
MTSNYRNSAGTDLDSLFLVNNSNAGAIGFKISDGTDLGNRYSNASTKLNQTIGFKNSAGTDIGYLRSNKTPTSSGNITVSYNTRNYKGTATIDGVNILYKAYKMGDQSDVYSSVKISNVKVNTVTYTYNTNGSNMSDSGYPYMYKSSTRPGTTGTYTVSFTKG